MNDSNCVVFTHDSNQVCMECQFVLQSRGINSQIVATENGYALIVDARFERQAEIEISAYVDENRTNVPTLSRDEPKPLHFLPGLCGYVLILCIVSTATGFSLIGVDWYLQGRIDAEQIYAGEWWRLATALTLHANAQHLVSNIGFGLLFLYFVGRYLGYGLSGLAMLLSGILGNAINVYMHGSTHYSIGASTAVFGMLGLLCAYVWKMRYFSQANWSKRLGPIFGGIALLAFTGTSGERTDIGAHLWGFVCGFGLGWICAQFNEKILLNQSAQKIYACTALVVLTLSWLVAILT